MRSYWEKDKGNKLRRVWSLFILVGGPIATVLYFLEGSYLWTTTLLVVLLFYYYLTFTTKLPVWVWKTNRYLYSSWIVRRLQGKRYSKFWKEFAEEWRERFGENI